jgi:hypothetical protein
MLQVQTILLRAQPSLIAKSIGSVVIPNWEPHPTVQYYCALAQLTFLCSSVDVDSQFKTTMKAIAASASSDSSTEKDRLKAEGSVRGVVTVFVQAMIPVGASLHSCTCRVNSQSVSLIWLSQLCRIHYNEFPLNI